MLAVALPLVAGVVVGLWLGPAAGFLAEIERMQREVREYLSLHPSEASGVA